MNKFLQENYLQIALLILLIGITSYAMATKQLNMVNSILMAVLTGLNLKDIKK